MILFAFVTIAIVDFLLILVVRHQLKPSDSRISDLAVLLLARTLLDTILRPHGYDGLKLGSFSDPTTRNICCLVAITQIQTKSFIVFN